MSARGIGNRNRIVRLLVLNRATGQDKEEGRQLFERRKTAEDHLAVLCLAERCLRHGMQPVLEARKADQKKLHVLHRERAEI
jgi:hypothetical protein